MFRFDEMKTQPDTTTMTGRHAVERASATCRIQFRYHPSTEWSLCNDTPGSNRLFDWRRSSYRIHPDDLAKLTDPAAQPADKWRPWTIEDLPIGIVVREKRHPQTIRLIVAATVDYCYLGGLGVVLMDDMFHNYEQLDGTPCGAGKEEV